MTLVRFAGYDPDEDVLPPRRSSGTSRRQRAYNLFILGYDTLEIAERIGSPERSILRWVSTERSQRKGLPAPYARRDSLEEA